MSDEKISIEITIPHLETTITLVFQKIAELESAPSAYTGYDSNKLKEILEHLKKELEKGKVKKEVERKVKEVLSAESNFDLAPEQIENDMLLIKSLGLGPNIIEGLALREFTLILQEYKPDSEISMSEAEGLKKVQDCIDLIIKKMEGEK